MPNLPKKILRIKDFTFILPDDFVGSFEDALNSFMDYTTEKLNPEAEKGVPDVYSSVRTLFSSENAERVCGSYGIFEFDTTTGKYELIESN